MLRSDSSEFSFRFLQLLSVLQLLGLACLLSILYSGQSFLVMLLFLFAGGNRTGETIDMAFTKRLHYPKKDP